MKNKQKPSVYINKESRINIHKNISKSKKDLITLYLHGSNKKNNIKNNMDMNNNNQISKLSF